MYCYNCNKKFYIRRTFLKLFETKKYYICDGCRKKYPLKVNIEDIRLETYNLKIICLFERTYNLKFDSYIFEINKIAKYLIETNPDYLFVFLDKLKLNDDSIEMLSFLADSENKDILLLCCELKK